MLASTMGQTIEQSLTPNTMVTSIIRHDDPNATGIFNVLSAPIADGTSSEGNATTVRLIDESCLGVETTYRLYVRGTDTTSTVQSIFYLNGPGGLNSPTSSFESTMSSVTLTEIRA